MAKITYADKTGLIPKTNHVNQFWDDDANEIKAVVNANDDRLTDVENTAVALTTDGIKKGGLVTWQTGLIFNISACDYIIGGSFYSSAYTQKTLTASDPTNPRIDIIVVDTSGLVQVVTGVAAADPQKPTANPQTQLELTSVLILAGATEPSTPGGDPISDDIIYDENTEWTGTSSGVTVDFASTAEVYNGTYSISTGAWAAGGYIKFVAGSPISTGFNTLSFFYFDNGITLLEHGLNVQLYLSGVAVSDSVPVIVPGYPTTYKWSMFSVDISLFTIYETTFDEVRFTYFGEESTGGVYLDLIQIQSGLTQAVESEFWEKSGDAIYPKSTTDKLLVGTKTSAGDYDLQVNESIHIGESVIDPATPADGVNIWARGDKADNIYARNSTTIFNLTSRGASSNIGTVSSNISIDVDKQCKHKITSIGGSVDITLNNLEASSRGIIFVNHDDATPYTITIYGNTDGTGNDYTALTGDGSGQIVLTTSGAGYVDVLRWEWIFPYLIITKEVVH